MRKQTRCKQLDLEVGCDELQRARASLVPVARWIALRFDGVQEARRCADEGLPPRLPAADEAEPPCDKQVLDAVVTVFGSEWARLLGDYETDMRLAALLGLSGAVCLALSLLYGLPAACTAASVAILLASPAAALAASRAKRLCLESVEAASMIAIVVAEGPAFRKRQLLDTMEEALRDLRELEEGR